MKSWTLIALVLTTLTCGTAYVTKFNTKSIFHHYSTTNSIPDSTKSIQLKNINQAAKFLAITPFLSHSLVSYADDSVPAPDASNFQTTESGLKYRELKVGSGEVPKPGDIVRVHYTGWLDNFDSEKKFDSSYDRRKPIVFKVGTRQVIAGKFLIQSFFCFLISHIYIRLCLLTK
jgi:hypothetical protein